MNRGFRLGAPRPGKQKNIADRVNRGFRLGASCPGKQKKHRGPREPGFSPRRISPRKRKESLPREPGFSPRRTSPWKTKKVAANRGYHFPANRGCRLVASPKTVRVISRGFIHLPGEPGFSSRGISPRKRKKVAGRMNRGYHFPANRGCRLVASPKTVRVISRVFTCKANRGLQLFIHLPLRSGSRVSRETHRRHRLESRG